MHARKLKNLEERFEWFSTVIETDPAALCGSWKAKRFPEAQRVHLDLGCGKGQWTVAAAQANPHDLYIGFDNQEVCVALAAQRAVEAGIENAVFCVSDGDELGWTVGDAEIDVLHLNFSTPHPRSKYTPLRLTHASRLASYERMLAPGGHIELKTDSQPFFDWSLEQFELAGWDVTWQTRDLHEEPADAPVDPQLWSGYEKRLCAKGARIHALVAMPGAMPTSSKPNPDVSLFDYLPQDIDAITYVPYGMEAGVQNLRNIRAKRGPQSQLPHHKKLG